MSAETTLSRSSLLRSIVSASLVSTVPSAPPASAARATCVGMSPWSRSRSTISDSLAASSSPTAIAPAGLTALYRNTGMSGLARDAQDFLERGDPAHRLAKTVLVHRHHAFADRLVAKLRGDRVLHHETAER